ncbi:hypothetical protein D3C83_211680 [compost metagenome]
MRPGAQPQCFSRLVIGLALEVRQEDGMRLKPFSKRAKSLSNEMVLDGRFVKAFARSCEV